MVNSSVTHGSYNLNSGIYFLTLSSQLSLPSSTSMPKAAVVNALLLEAMPKSVFSSTGCRVSRDRTPYPFECMTFPSLTTQTAIPGTSKVRSVRSTKLSMATEDNGCAKPQNENDKNIRQIERILIQLAFTKYRQKTYIPRFTGNLSSITKKTSDNTIGLISAATLSIRNCPFST